MFWTLLLFSSKSAIIHDKTDCLYKIWSAIIIIIPKASITMANMSWVITVSRDGDDGESILRLKAEPHLWS